MRIIIFFTFLFLNTLYSQDFSNDIYYEGIITIRQNLKYNSDAVEEIYIEFDSNFINNKNILDLDSIEKIFYTPVGSQNINKFMFYNDSLTVFDSKIRCYNLIDDSKILNKFSCRLNKKYVYSKYKIKAFAKLKMFDLRKGKDYFEIEMYFKPNLDFNSKKNNYLVLVLFLYKLDYLEAIPPNCSDMR